MKTASVWKDILFAICVGLTIILSINVGRQIHKYLNAPAKPANSWPGPTNNLGVVMLHQLLTEDESSNLYSEVLKSRTNQVAKWFYLGNPQVKVSYYGDSPTKEQIVEIAEWLMEFNRSGLAAKTHTVMFDQFTLTWSKDSP